MSEADELLTDEQAWALSQRRRLDAVTAALRPFVPASDLDTVAALVIDVYQAVEGVSPSDCPDVHPKFGQCVREYGHPPYIVERRIATDDKGNAKREPADNRAGYNFVYEDQRDESAQGHYTVEYEDRRRPDGSHPYDY